MPLPKSRVSRRMTNLQVGKKMAERRVPHGTLLNALAEKKQRLKALGKAREQVSAGLVKTGETVTVGKFVFILGANGRLSRVTGSLPQRSYRMKR